ncbi:dihydrofolate reductase [Flavobacterium sp.]|uniref:dihydrofolate reductase n=1 Tax=Flavobacterium sp. TaxID=239 RepID=UPI00286E7018|nr:dihydrofolate reductase [Flavobacterium sp.]
MITIIAAVGKNNELGKDNKIIWHLPDDFKRFKALTTGHYIIMGRKTFESFPKPLPNRTHIVISRNHNYQVPDGCFVVNSIEKAIEMCPKNETLFIIGGGEIYKQSIEITDTIELTRIHNTFDADAYFPEIDLNKWKLVASEFHPIDEKHQHSFDFETYKRSK